MDQSIFIIYYFFLFFVYLWILAQAYTFLKGTVRQNLFCIIICLSSIYNLKSLHKIKNIIYILNLNWWYKILKIIIYYNKKDNLFQYII